MRDFSPETRNKVKGFVARSIVGAGIGWLLLSLLLLLPIHSTPKRQIRAVSRIAMIYFLGGSASTLSWAIARSYPSATQSSNRAQKPICNDCYYRSYDIRLPCAVNPKGPTDNTCLDYQPEEAEEATPWQKR